jgi:Holliday junction resolvase RusA-like endonuclease
VNTVFVAVYGLPQQQGSKQGFIINGKVVLVETNKKLKPWRELISAAAREVMQDREPCEGPVKVEILFRFPRLKAHLRADGEVREEAPFFKSSTPDLDKLVRAACDACSGIIYKDDRQVSYLSAKKIYAELQGMWMIVTPL